MFEPEYRASFRVLSRKIGLWSTIRISLISMKKSRTVTFKGSNVNDKPKMKKIMLKNHFKLLAKLYEELLKRYGEEKTLNIMQALLIECGPIFMRGFKSLGPDENLKDFIPIYKEFESQNLMFDVIEESDSHFEIRVKRCLIYEAFKELGLESITQWMCDVAFLYFSNYHPKMKYFKDKMIAKGDEYCHEVFTWQN